MWFRPYKCQEFGHWTNRPYGGLQAFVIDGVNGVNIRLWLWGYGHLSITCSLPSWIITNNINVWQLYKLTGNQPFFIVMVKKFMIHRIALCWKPACKFLISLDSTACSPPSWIYHINITIGVLWEGHITLRFPSYQIYHCIILFPTSFLFPYIHPLSSFFCGR